MLENELHAILNCNMYEDLRDALFKKASECSLDFDSMSDEEKFMFLFSQHQLSSSLCQNLCFNTAEETIFNL